MVRKESLSTADSIRQSLFPKQLQVIQDKSRRKAVLCPRRAGKSWVAMAYAHLTCLEKPNRVVLILTLTLKSAKNTYWNTILKRFHQHFGLKPHVHNTDMRLTFDNGSSITFVGAETRSEIEKLRGGSYDLVIIDECKSYPAGILSELIADVLRPATADREGVIMMIGTPGHMLSGPFYEATYPGHMRPPPHNMMTSRFYEDPEPFWADRKRGWLWSRHHWASHDNLAAPQVWKDALETKEENGWTDDHPTWVREYLGQWVAADDAFVYAYAQLYDQNPDLVSWQPDPAKGKHGLPEGHEWRFILGLDLGFEDDFAAVINAYSLTDGTLFNVHNLKLPHQDVYQIADHITAMLEMFGDKVDAAVGDAAGLGKMVIETLNRRHGFNIQPAEKREKYDFIELINADFKAGKIRIARHSDLDLEMRMLQWDLSQGTRQELLSRAKLKEHRSLPNHLCDAFLYTYKYSYHTYGSSPMAQAALGSAEWFRQVEEASIQRMIDRAQGNTSYLDEYIADGVNPMEQYD